MLKFLQLGIIKQNNQTINHRTLRKIFLNPILRVFGFAEEIFEEIITLIHSFAMKMYSKRKGKNSFLIEEEK